VTFRAQMQSALRAQSGFAAERYAQSVRYAHAVRNPHATDPSLRAQRALPRSGSARNARSAPEAL
jgi:hypothetical protein